MASLSATAGRTARAMTSRSSSSGYDELVAEVEEWEADLQGFRQCLLDVPQWVRSLKIPVDVPEEDMWVGDRFRKG
jgi:hypothetical protein